MTGTLWRENDSNRTSEQCPCRRLLPVLQGRGYSRSLTCFFAPPGSFEAARSSARLDSCGCCSGRWSSLILECSSPNLEQRERAELHVYCQQQHVYVLCGRRLHKLLLGLWRLFDWRGVGCLTQLPDERKLPSYSHS